jgi:hypothetical protein
MATLVILGLVAAELVLGVAVAFVYWRRMRRMRVIEAIGRVNELVGHATRLGRRAQDPQLSLAERAALLEETRAALDEALLVLHSTPRPLALPPEALAARESWPPPAREELPPAA